MPLRRVSWHAHAVSGETSMSADVASQRRSVVGENLQTASRPAHLAHPGHGLDLPRAGRTPACEPVPLPAARAWADGAGRRTVRIWAMAGRKAAHGPGAPCAESAASTARRVPLDGIGTAFERVTSTLVMAELRARSVLAHASADLRATVRAARGTRSFRTLMPTLRTAPSASLRSERSGGSRDEEEKA